MSELLHMKVRSKGMLRQHGDMLGSFNYQVNGDQLMLGFSDQKALWHHGGTKPYTIRPVRAKALAFAGLVRKRVHHPGLPKRPLIGFPASDQQLIEVITRDYLNQAIKGA